MSNTLPILMPIIGVESGNRWRLVGTWRGDCLKDGNWTYAFQYKGNNYRLTIPFGFSADGASVPYILRSIVRMGGRDMPDEAWLPHDYMYSVDGRFTGELQIQAGLDWININKVSKKFADDVFFAELKKKKHGLASFKPIVAYLGVRLAFWNRW